MSAMTNEQSTVAQTNLRRRYIQRESGDGASEWSDEEFDTKSLYRDREGSHARTTFFHWDSSLPKSADRDKWRRLAEWNHGKGEDDQTPRKWHAGKVNDAELFCDHLNFTQEMTEKVVEITKDMDFDQFGKFSTEQVMASLCSLVSDENTTDFEDRIVVKDEFKELMDVTGLGSKENRKIRQAIRERTDYY